MTPEHGAGGDAAAGVEHASGAQLHVVADGGQRVHQHGRLLRGGAESLGHQLAGDGVAERDHVSRVELGQALGRADHTGAHAAQRRAGVDVVVEHAEQFVRRRVQVDRPDDLQCLAPVTSGADDHDSPQCPHAVQA